MVPELLQGKRRKSTIEDDGGNEEDEMEEEEDGSYIENRSIEEREPDETTVTGDIGVIEDIETDIKPPLIAPSPPNYMGDVQLSSHGAIPRSVVMRPSVIRFQSRDQREAGTSGGGQSWREGREQAGLVLGHGGMTVSGENIPQ